MEHIRRGLPDCVAILACDVKVELPIQYSIQRCECGTRPTGYEAHRFELFQALVKIRHLGCCWWRTRRCRRKVEQAARCSAASDATGRCQQIQGIAAARFYRVELRRLVRLAERYTLQGFRRRDGHARRLRFRCSDLPRVSGQPELIHVVTAVINRQAE